MAPATIQSVPFAENIRVRVSAVLLGGMSAAGTVLVMVTGTTKLFVITMPSAVAA